MDYYDFLFSQLFMKYVENNETQYNELEYDIINPIMLEHLKKYGNSEYFLVNKSEYDCIVDYLTNEIPVKTVKSKAVFYQPKLVEVQGNVLDHVYPHLKDNQLTMTERMGSEEASCPDCGGNHWWLLPEEGVAVAQGGKPCIECLGCGYLTHL